MINKGLVNHVSIFSIALIWMSCGTPPTPDPVETNAPVAAAPAPMLVILDAERTGINFVNRIIEDDSANYLNFRYIYNSGGVATGDLDNDGLPEIVCVSNRNGGAIYKNNGDLKFSDVSQNAGFNLVGLWATGVCMMDANADGLLDIYVCASGPGYWPVKYRRNRLYINKGDLKFVDEAAERGVADEGHHTTASFADLDGDGDLDLYILAHRVDFKNLNNAIIDPRFLPVADQSDRLYLNDGTGHFSEHSKTSGTASRSWGLGVAIGDVNGDGRNDIYTSCDYYSPNKFLINDGTRDGIPRFTDRALELLKHTSYFAMGVDRADVNNDGVADMMELDMAIGDHKLSKENMAGMKPDQFRNMVKNGMNHQYMVNSLHLGLGNGHFAEIAQAAGVDKTDWSWCPLIVDLDNDGWKDLYISNGITRDVGNVDFNIKANAVTEAGGGQPHFKQILDLAPRHYKETSVFRNKGDLTFEKAMDPWNFHHSTAATGASYADLDGDGDLDIVSADVNDKCKVIENRARQLGKGHFIQVLLKGEDLNPNAIGTTVTIKNTKGIQSFELWLGRGFQSSVEPLVHFGLGDGSVDEMVIDWYDGTRTMIKTPTIDQRMTVDMKTSERSVRTVQTPTPFFADRSTDLSGITAHNENAFDDFARDPLLPQQQSQHGPGAAVADVNDDDLDDVIITGASGTAATLYLQNGSGKFAKAGSQPWSVFKNSEFVGAHFFDADGDGDQDLYLAAGSTEFPQGAKEYRDRLFLNNGKGSFAEAVDALPETFHSTSCVISEDLDNDGDLDLFVGGRNVPGLYPYSPQSHVLLNEKGRFVDATSNWIQQREGYGMITAAQFADLDGDKKNELILAAEWMPLRVLKNTGKNFSDVTSSMVDTTLSGWWQGLRVEDIDGDGDMDILAGNIGMNNKFHPNRDHPLKIYSGDLDGSGTNDIVLAKTGESGELPVRGRECSSQQCPVILQKFPSFKSFAEADLQKIYGSEKLAQALQLSASEFKSMVFINNGQGKFTATALPNRAQLFPIRDFIVQDVNGDGKKDIICGGNLYGAEVETVRYDAGVGLLLLGDGSGNFSPVQVTESGIFSPYDTRHVIPISIGASGNKGALFVNNNGPVQLFLATGNAVSGMATLK